ncbi:MAG: hypothetical protein ACXVBY_17135 [Isosphaeraceae bacterium]
MRLYRMPGPTILGLPVCRCGRGFEAGCWSLTATPVKEENRLVSLGLRETRLAAAAFLERQDGRLADFFCF